MKLLIHLPKVNTPEAVKPFLSLIFTWFSPYSLWCIFNTNITVRPYPILRFSLIIWQKTHYQSLGHCIEDSEGQTWVQHEKALGLINSVCHLDKIGSSNVDARYLPFRWEMVVEKSIFASLKNVSGNWLGTQ